MRGVGSARRGAARRGSRDAWTGSSTQNSDLARDALEADVAVHQLARGARVMTSPMPVPSMGPVSWPARWNG